MGEDFGFGVLAATITAAVITLVIIITISIHGADIRSDCDNFGKVKLSTIWYECQKK